MKHQEQTFEQLGELFAYTSKGRPLSSSEAAELMGLHPVTLDRWRMEGNGPRYFSPQGTRRVWYAEKDVLHWLASGAKRSTSEAA